MSAFASFGVGGLRYANPPYDPESPTVGIVMIEHSLDFPEGYDGYAWQIESKGWFGEAKLSYAGRRYRLNFYDPVRLVQEIQSGIQRRHFFFEPNLVIVQSLTRQNMENAAAQLIELGVVSSLIAD